mgnify:CR=1 FL=1
MIPITTIRLFIFLWDLDRGFRIYFWHDLKYGAWIIGSGLIE